MWAAVTTPGSPVCPSSLKWALAISMVVMIMMMVMMMVIMMMNDDDYDNDDNPTCVIPWWWGCRDILEPNVIAT